MNVIPQNDRDTQLRVKNFINFQVGCTLWLQSARLSKIVELQLNHASNFKMDNNLDTKLGIAVILQYNVCFYNAFLVLTNLE